MNKTLAFGVAALGFGAGVGFYLGQKSTRWVIGSRMGKAREMFQKAIMDCIGALYEGKVPRSELEEYVIEQFSFAEIAIRNSI